MPDFDWPDVVAACVSIVATTVVMFAVLPTLRRQAIDLPNHRSSHSKPIPRGGGVAVLAGIVGGWTASALTDNSLSTWFWLVGSVALGIVGMLDDIRSLSTRIRLSAQLVVAIVVVGYGVMNSSFGPLTWGAGVIIYVGFVNAFNFMDGVNGISALSAIVAGGCFTYLGSRYSVAGVVPLALAVTFSSLAFLPWNAPSARVFLGDSGSYCLGALICGLSIACYFHGAPLLSAAAPLVVYGVDTGWVLVKRVVGGRPIGVPHREHVYQQLADGGWSHLATAICAATFTGLCCAAAILWASTPWVTGIVLGVISGTYLLLPKMVGSHLEWGDAS